MSSGEGSARSGSSSSSGRSSGSNSPSLARSRWDLLQDALRKKSIPESSGHPASKRSFERYDSLFDSIPLSKEYMRAFVYIPSHSAALDSVVVTNLNEELGLRLPAKSQPRINVMRNKNNGAAVYSADIYRKCLAPDLGIFKDLQGFDKTGRICIWPSEQVLASWCLKNLDLFAGNSVIELGGGFHCLGGVSLAMYSKAKQVTVTDGDGFNMDCVAYSIKANKLAPMKCRATALVWGEFQGKPELESSFDFAIAADVLYRSSSFRDLLDTVKHVLKPGGQCLLFNPTRNGVLHEFLELAQKQTAFSEVKVTDNYDAVVTSIEKDLYKRHIAYSREWHYPQLVVLTKVVNYTASDELL